MIASSSGSAQSIFHCINDKNGRIVHRVDVCKSNETLAPIPDDNTVLVFAASETFLGDGTGDGNPVGSLWAHEHCQRLANTAGHDGIFYAWVSNTVLTPANKFLLSSGPWVRVDGVRVALDFDDLTDDSLLAPIDRTEFGVSITPQPIWTGTDEMGQATLDDCDG